MNNTVELGQETIKQIAELVKPEIMSNAAQIILAVVPIIGVLFGAALFFSLFYFYHKQKMLMIEKEIYKPLRLNWNLIFIVSGFIFMLSGVAITVVFIINGSTGYELLGGGVTLGVGVAIILSYILSSKVSGGKRQ